MHRDVSERNNDFLNISTWFSTAKQGKWRRVCPKVVFQKNFRGRKPSFSTNPPPKGEFSTARMQKDAREIEIEFEIEIVFEFVFEFVFGIVCIAKDACACPRPHFSRSSQRRMAAARRFSTSSP